MGPRLRVPSLPPFTGTLSVHMTQGSANNVCGGEDGCREGWKGGCREGWREGAKEIRRGRERGVGMQGTRLGTHSGLSEHSFQAAFVLNEVPQDRSLAPYHLEDSL